MCPVGSCCSAMTMKKKTLYIIIIFFLAVLSGCMSPNTVNPVVNEASQSNAMQGNTSITVDQAEAEKVVGSDSGQSEADSALPEASDGPEAAAKEPLCLVDGHAPLLACIETCGNPIIWTDADNAFFVRDQKYLISVSEKSIMAEGSSLNLVTPPPGTSSGYIEADENEIYVDLETLSGVFQLLHMDASLLDFANDG